MLAGDEWRRLYFKEMEVLLNDRITHGSNGKGSSPTVRSEEHATDY